MEITEYYGVCLAAVLALLLVPLLLFAAGWLREYVGHDINCLLNPLLPAWLSGQALISRYEAALFGCLLVANGLYIGVGNTSIDEAERRLGHVALINLVLMSCGAHMNHIVSICGIRHDRYFRFHASLGSIFTAEAVLHTILALRNWSIGDMAGLIASCSVGATAVSSLLCHWLFELFSLIHMLLSSATLVALWFHLPSTPLNERPRLYLFLCSVLLISIKLIRFLNIIYSSFSGRRQSTATIQKHGDCVEIRVRMARPLKFQAGQFVYLSLWGLSALSAFEFHPFQICWVDDIDQNSQDSQGPRQVIVLLAQARRGFSRRLLTATRYEHRALIEGPYGKTLPLGQYGTVLLFATDMGIAGQLPYIRELLDHYRQCQTKTRRIALFWELHAEDYRYWVKPEMDKMLRLDVDYILDMQLYVRGHFLSRRTSEGDVVPLGEHGRITLNYEAMRPDVIVASEMKTLCTDPATTRAIMSKNAVYQNDQAERKENKMVKPQQNDNQDVWQKDVHVKMLDFQPWARGKMDARSLVI
ncbi:hypothetical protein F5X96DRAFT_683938 [Biscogniauxia mediterranea]|nr:hypothetical protein F5X96DRAFT_683938 [Biscogniauxia mediterranea]